MLKRLLIVLVVLLSIIIGLWYIGIPDSWIVETAEGLLQTPDIQTELKGFRKTPFFGFRIKEIRIRHGDIQLFRIEDISAQIDPVSLLLLKGKVSFSGQLSGGSLSGNVVFKKDDFRMEIDLQAAKLEGLSLMDALSIRGKGRLYVTGTIDKGAGKIFFEVKDLAVDNIIRGKLYMPMSYFDHIKGAVTLSDKGVRIDALSMEGDQIYSRMKGVLTGGYFEGSLEVMPEPELPKGLLSLIESYEKTPGYYVIPLKGRVTDIL